MDNVSTLKEKFFFMGKTFDDFLLKPQLGVVSSRSTVSLKSRFTPKIELNLPVVAANMDTVTGPDMCIALAREGGIGILPRSDAISIETQIEWVKKVKRAESFIIYEPYCVGYDQKLSKAREMMARLKVGTLLVVNDDGQLVGILDIKRRMRLASDRDDDALVEEFMTPADEWGYTQESSIDSLDDAVRILKHYDKPTLPWLDEDLYIRGLIKMKDISNLLHHTWANKDKFGRLRVGATVGARGNYIERAGELISAGVDVIVMDTAHAHSNIIARAVDNFRSEFPDFELVVGNIATAEAAKFYHEKGVSALKVGIGPGKGCLTRMETSFGVPQLEALRSVWSAVGPDMPIICDGGMRRHGHIALSLLAGASSAMLGGFFAGTDEAPGRVITDPATKTKFKIFRGMTSPEVKIEGDNDSSAARQGNPQNVEGQSSKVPYVGSVKDILNSIRQNLQSAVSYSGEQDLSSARAKIAANPQEFLIPLSSSSKEESFSR